MEYYLLRISYSTAGWDSIIKNARSFDQRMEPVRKLIAGLGGSFASFHFYEHAEFKDPARQHAVFDKFAVFCGEDLMGVLAMPDKLSAQSFKLALLAQPGIRTIELTSMVPYAEVISTSLPASSAAMTKTGYAGPGPAAP